VAAALASRFPPIRGRHMDTRRSGFQHRSLKQMPGPLPPGQRPASAAAGLLTNGHEDMHAGELETSILLHAFPGVVREGNSAADHEASDRDHLLTLGMRGYTQSGVIGRPSLGTADKGKAILESLVTSFADQMRLLTQP